MLTVTMSSQEYNKYKNFISKDDTIINEKQLALIKYKEEYDAKIEQIKNDILSKISAGEKSLEVTMSMAEFLKFVESCQLSCDIFN